MTMKKSGKADAINDMLLKEKCLRGLDQLLT